MPRRRVQPATARRLSLHVAVGIHDTVHMCVHRSTGVAAGVAVDVDVESVVAVASTSDVRD
jgi:hypothetical protein